MKAVNIAHLKSHLSEHLRQVRAGRVLTVLDRNTPIALLTPMNSNEDVVITPPAEHARSLAKVKLPPPVRIRVDVVDVLLEDRRKRR